MAFIFYIIFIGSLSSVVVAVIQPEHFAFLWVLIPLFVLLLPEFYALTMSDFIPIEKHKIPTLLKLAKIKSTDVVYDMGSGDGRLVFAAAPYAKKAIGYELSIPLLIQSKVKNFFRHSKASFRFGNFFHQDFRDATVIFCYLPEKIIKRFQKEIMSTLKLGTRIVISISVKNFTLTGLKPAAQEDKVYLYIR